MSSQPFGGKKSQTTLVLAHRPLDLELKLVSATRGTIRIDEGEIGLVQLFAVQSPQIN
jgi:hypothetical protein